MALKRVNVFLEEETMPKLKKLIERIKEKGSYGLYSLTASDLIRFAIKECYGIGRGGIHYYDVDELRCRIKRAMKKSGGK